MACLKFGQVDSDVTSVDIQWREHEHRDALADALARELTDIIQDAVTHRGGATLALAGGSTPVPAYRRLRQLGADLARTRITPTDERWVPITDRLNNARMLQEALGRTWTLVRLAAAEDASDPGDPGALEAARRELVRLPQPFDAVLLGMGTDGHFASLFPDDPAIADLLTSTDRVVPAYPPSQPTPRVSLTPHTLLHTRKLLLAITGEDKRAVLDDALRDGPTEELPIRAVLRSGQPLTVHYSP